ncbi:hypothetical protein Q1695_002378 [Nippostrongylus brasiliensis]|nr:hypothetical protein Q1695_002378 [Nippostrongylus brasiliensis]
MQNANWYEQPLNYEDVLAGGSLISISTMSILLYAVIIKVMRKQDKVVIGYRFLISAGFSDIVLLVNYGIWPGLTILLKSEMIPTWGRHWLQLYLDWAWFAMVWHYTVVGWSRWSAIRSPIAFRAQSRKRSYTICAFCYIIALIQVLATHFQPWYVTFYYEPSSYGMLADDFELYLTGGQSMMFLTFHLIAIIPPIIFYTWTLALLLKRRRIAMNNANSAVHVAHSHIESRLLLPCLLNMVVFIFGQVVITNGTGEGKWAGFSVMLVFCTNSALNPWLLLLCSASIRRQLLEMIGFSDPSFGPEKFTTTIYGNPLALKCKGDVTPSPALSVQVRLYPSPIESESSTKL